MRRNRRYGIYGSPQVLTKHEEARMVGPVAACADCSSYTPVDSLIEKQDGRKVCPGCQRTIEEKTAERSQLEMFCAQQSLLSLIP